MIREIYNLDFEKSKKNKYLFNNELILKNNYLLNNLVSYINNMLNKKKEEEITLFKNKLSNFLIYKNSFHHHILFELFYNKYNYTLVPYELLEQLSFYYKDLLNIINSKKYIKSTKLSII